MRDNGRMDLGSRSSDKTASVARNWVDSWTRGDVDEIRAALADDATVECNLGWPATVEALLETVRRLSSAIDGTMILSVTATDQRAAVLSDCRLLEPSGGLRVAEFLDIADERIIGVRRVFDLTAVDTLLPALRDQSAS